MPFPVKSASEPIPFMHLHIKSHFSMMWGTASLRNIARHLKRDGQYVFPLTDRNGVFGLVQHLKTCREEGLRPVIGCELFSDHASLHTEDHTPVQALCLVKTQQGYQNMCVILTDMNFHPERPLEELIRNRHEGLTFITQTPRILSLAREEGAEIFIDLCPGQMEQAEKLKVRWKLPLAASIHASMLSPDCWKRHLILRAIDCNGTLSRKDMYHHARRQDYLWPRTEVLARLSAFPEALRATGRILERCVYTPQTGSLIFPSRSHQRDAKLLRQKAYSGARKRIGKLTPQARNRLEFELNMIRKKGFESPFLVAEDIVQRFPITCGRGSAAASLVAYCLYITHVNPLEHNLFFERFLNEGRQDPPDIDIDFPWDERDKVRSYLWNKYGHNRIAMVANHNHLQMKGCLREIAKVFGFGPTEITRFINHLRRLKRGGRVPVLTPAWRHVVQWAEKLEGTPRCLSVHCGGVVITPEDMSRYAPVYKMPIGFPTLPWDKDDVERFGFVKLDFLGNRSLAVIRDTLNQLPEEHSLPSYENLNPIDDPDTQTLIASGRTVGCFYIESPATRQLLQKIRHGDYETLVAVSSIIRPAANKVTEAWIKRHRHILRGGSPNWPSIHPAVEEVLHETHGLMVYQEDVTRTAMKLAGFNAFEGNQLRKIISRKAPEKLTVIKNHFISGCYDYGLSEQQTKDLWAMIESFSGYSFCKPHSASYALVSFKAAYLKQRFPEYFLAAVLSNYGGFYSTSAYLNYARRLGIRIQPPDINTSQRPFSASHRQITIGFEQIKGLHTSSVTQIIKERKHGRFTNLKDFMDRVTLPSKDLKKLILVGAFDKVEPGQTRSTLMLRALCHSPCQEDNICNAFHSAPECFPQLPAFNKKQRDALETEILGFPVSRTPLERFTSELQCITHITAEKMDTRPGQSATMFGTLISAKTVRTHTHEKMAFLTFEDNTDMFECVAFPAVYQACASDMEHGSSYLLKGHIENQQGAVSLHLSKLTRLT